MSTEVESISSASGGIVSSQAASKQVTEDLGAKELRSCCEQTVKLYAAHNPMILCQECNHLIKCFTELEHFNNYIAFCESRNREVLISELGEYKVVVFRNIENFR